MDERYKHKDITGFEGLYALGEHGKVYSYRSGRYLNPNVVREIRPLMWGCIYTILESNEFT